MLSTEHAHGLQRSEAGGMCAVHCSRLSAGRAAASPSAARGEPGAAPLKEVGPTLPTLQLGQSATRKALPTTQFGRKTHQQVLLFFFLATPCACRILVPAASSLWCSWGQAPRSQWPCLLSCPPLPRPHPIPPTLLPSHPWRLPQPQHGASAHWFPQSALLLANHLPPPTSPRLMSPHSSFVSELLNYVRASVTFIRLPDGTDWRSQQELHGINQKALQQHWFEHDLIL